ncbi:MAG: hypothetical protein U0529_21855 [Thermoanaerobaculia bacterium]
MKMVWLVLKVLAGVVGLLVLAVVLFVGLVLVRKSNLFVLRGDLEQMTASGISPAVASGICGTKVDMLRGLRWDGHGPEDYFPKASVRSWRPFFPMEGTASVRVVGAGFHSLPWDRGGGSEKVTGRCEGTVTFRYRFHWADNGRAVVLESQFLEGPTVVRDR